MAPQIKYTKLFIDNEWRDAESGRTYDTFNPHDGTVIARVAEGDKADIDAAVAAAGRAFLRNSEWRAMDAARRGAVLHRFADLVQRDAASLAELESYNNGTLFSLCQSVMPEVVNLIRYLASLADKIQGDTIPCDGEVFAFTLKQPVGVCGVIVTFNRPIAVFVNKVTTALAAGCTVVVKPAEQTPLTALALAALLVEAGLPRGVLNVVNGYRETAGVALTHHPHVAMISFSGSADVGKLVYQAAAAANLKRVTLELGGKNPLVIMNDADLEAAVQCAAKAVFLYSGQACLSPSRVFVQAAVHDQVVRAAVQAARALRIGHPADPTTDHGPQVNEVQMNKILDYIEKGKQEGATLLTGGKRVGTTGYYIEPTVFADVTDDMTIAKEEIFGPVQSILKFDTLEEVIERANATRFGLAAGIFTSDINTALYFTKHVEAGVVWVNTYLTAGPQNPFGGFKDSGIGREKGLNCVDSFLEVKTVTTFLPKKL